MSKELLYKEAIEEIKEYAQMYFTWYDFKTNKRDKQIATDWKKILDVIERTN